MDFVKHSVGLAENEKASVKSKIESLERSAQGSRPVKAKDEENVAIN
jgi:hypothetical protein